MRRTFVLFLCIHNSARSQMAEGLLRHLYGDRYRAFSAGTVATAVSPYAVMAMQRIGVDISKQWSKTVQDLDGKKMNVVVTVCDEGAEACPFVPGAREYIHWSIEDPGRVTGSEEERLAAFEKTRKILERKIRKTFGE
jgi:arsenate reductase